LNIFQKFQINEENKLFNEGKATFYEELNENSDLPKDVFEKEKEGDINLSPRFFGDLDIDKSKWFTHPQLERLYRLVNRQSLPDNYDSRSSGKPHLIKGMLYKTFYGHIFSWPFCLSGLNP
jgi:hypothetical protein